MPRVVLVRHAAVDNPRGIFYGHLETFGLSADGRDQARSLGRALAEMGARRIVHSPLRRARETAELAAAEIGVDVEMEQDAALVEALFGRYLQGVPYRQVPFRRPLWLVHRIRRGLLPSDETIGAMGRRVLRVVERIATQYPNEITACVSHGDPLQAAWVLLEGRRETERELGRKRVEHAGMLVVDFEGAGRSAVAYVGPCLAP